MRTALLVSNVRLSEVGGRAEKFRSHERLFAEHGWNLEVAYVPEPDAAFPLHLARAFRKARQTDPDVVIAVSNPFHLQFVGWALARATGAKWVAELRDPILNNPDREPGALVTRLAAVAERFTLRHADAVVWFDGIQIPDDYFDREYPDHAGKMTKLPYIGYDEPAFDIEPREFDEWTLSYAGAFYEGWIEPYAVIEGVAEYADRTGDRAFRVRFYGDWSDDYQQAVEDHGVGDIVSAHGYVPHDEVVPIIAGSDAVLYVGGSDPRNARNLSTKLYDYIGARVPILAVCDPEFRVAEFVREYGLGVVAEERPDAVADALARLREGYEYEPDDRALGFTRARAIDAYADVLDGLLGEGSR
ncbi:glycosyltransferase [Natronomonas sp. EA1]|uniref:glycosyltransferase n=1 Tax=Natronomonas sp. EA1 TaxID=3421655 RepID=UPI003EB82DC4